MADHMEYDTNSAFKRRITEVHLTHPQETPTLQQEQEQEPSEESSDVTSSKTPKQDCPETSMEADSNLSKKLRCSHEKDFNFAEEKQEPGSVNGKVADCEVLLSGFGGNHGKLEAFGGEVEERRNAEVGLVGKGEKDCVKIEVGCSGVQDCDEVSEENEKEMKSEALLEAEKKRLLAEVEHGRVFEDKTLLKKASSPEGLSQIDEKLSGCEEVKKVVQNDGERIEGFKITDASARGSLKVEVIDETALIETVQLPRSGNGCGRGRKKGDKEQEGDGIKARRSRRKGKDTKKAVNMSQGLKNLNHNVVDQDGGVKNGKQAKVMYSMKEMEALRFVNVVEQRKLWRDIYTGLGPVVMKEYDDLSSSRHQKHIPLNFNPQQHFMRKPEAPGILSVVAARGRGNHFNIFAH